MALFLVIRLVAVSMSGIWPEKKLVYDLKLPKIAVPLFVFGKSFAFCYIPLGSLSSAGVFFFPFKPFLSKLESDSDYCCYIAISDQSSSKPSSFFAKIRREKKEKLQRVGIFYSTGAKFFPNSVHNCFRTVRTAFSRRYEFRCFNPVLYYFGRDHKTLIKKQYGVGGKTFANCEGKEKSRKSANKNEIKQSEKQSFFIWL